MNNVKHSFEEKIKHFLTNPGCSNPIITNEKGVTPTPTLLGQSPNGKNSVIKKDRKAF